MGFFLGYICNRKLFESELVFIMYLCMFLDMKILNLFIVVVFFVMIVVGLVFVGFLGINLFEIYVEIV